MSYGSRRTVLFGLLALLLLLWPVTALAAPVAAPSPDVAAAPSAATVTYIVRRGDTLAGIAARYGTTVRALMTLNGLGNANRIYVGQVLVIRRDATTPPVTGSTSGRWIDVNLSRQRLTAYNGSTAVFTTLVSTGLPRTPTVVGRFRILTKVRSQTMSGPGYRLPGVEWVMYFYRGYATHGTYWHKNFGRPMSHGCVNMTNADARWLYNWASIGTPVVTHY